MEFWNAFLLLTAISWISSIQAASLYRGRLGGKQGDGHDETDVEAFFKSTGKPSDESFEYKPSTHETVAAPTSGKQEMVLYNSSPQHEAVISPEHHGGGFHLELKWFGDTPENPLPQDPPPDRPSPMQMSPEALDLVTRLQSGMSDLFKRVLFLEERLRTIDEALIEEGILEAFTGNANVINQEKDEPMALNLEEEDAA